MKTPSPRNYTSRARRVTHSPPPRPPGRAGKIAHSSQAPDQRVTLEPDAAHELGDLIGINVSTATPAALKETLRTLSDSHSLQVGPLQRYPQIQSQAAAPLPSLKKNVVHRRERLLELAHPRPPESKKCPSSNTETRPVKRPRAETPGESADEEMLDPDADKPEPDSPSPPHVSLLLPSSQPLPSTSSTQRAIVNAFASQRVPLRAASGPDFRPTPVPQTKGSFTRFAPRPRSPSHEPGPPSPGPRPPGPDPRPFSPGPRLSSPEPPGADVNPDTNPEPHNTGPTPELRRAKPTLPTRSGAPSTSGRKPPPDPNSVTESETESEPELKPKPKRQRR
ncbi:hypothetical protein FRC08_003955 [Ceratobasidium sp. 394]|nr:hypothetical protein FRC08_003955 [Ceratobasidium sp. 394]